MGRLTGNSKRGNPMANLTSSHFIGIIIALVVGFIAGKMF